MFLLKFPNTIINLSRQQIPHKKKTQFFSFFGLLNFSKSDG